MIKRYFYCIFLFQRIHCKACWLLCFSSIDAENEPDAVCEANENASRQRTPLPLWRRCAHLINHAGGAAPSVTSVSFAWADVLQLLPTHDTRRYRVCNRLNTGRVWYIDPSSMQPRLVPAGAPDTAADDARRIDPLVLGVAFVALRDIAAGEELAATKGVRAVVK